MGAFPDFINSTASTALLIADINGDGLPGAFPEFVNSEASAALVIAVINEDGLPDVISGNYGEQNHRLLVNEGDGIFEEKENAFPNDDTYKNTRGLAVADLKSNGLLGVIVCNDGQPNQLFYNQRDDDSSFQEGKGVFDGDNSRCTSIVAPDVNGDNRDDIIIGNAYQRKQVLLNRGNGMFEELTGSFPEVNLINCC